VKRAAMSRAELRRVEVFGRWPAGRCGWQLERKTALRQPNVASPTPAMLDPVPSNLHTDTNEEKRRQLLITVIPVAPRIRANRSANP